MHEYIERDKAIEALCKYCLANGNCGHTCKEITALQSIPAADVRPVVKAHWIKCNRGAGYKCSVCKARSSCADVMNGNHKFCYKCGAMMEES